MNPVQAIPPGMHSVTPHLVCRNAADAIAFYVKAFDATEMARLPAPDGRIMHAMVQIGDSPVMLVDEFPEYDSRGPQSIGGTGVVIHLYVENVDATFAKAIEAGAKSIMPPTDMFWGDRYGQVEDPFGHRWSIATHVRDLTPDEIRAAAAQGCPESCAKE